MTPEEIQLSNIASHSFDAWATDLMNTPPWIDTWQKDQVGPTNNGPYRAGFEALPITESNEPLVLCSDYGIVSKDYYLNKAWDYFFQNKLDYLDAITQRLLWPTAWVRKSIVQKLFQADHLLRQHDLFLYVASGWRHPAVQKMAVSQAGEKLSAAEVKRLFGTKSPHATGGAVDIELYSLQSFLPLSLSYPGDEYGFYNLESKPNPSPIDITKRNVRRILYHVLTHYGFTIHPGEFWHFGYGDPMSSYLTHQPSAIYGPISPPESTQLTHFQV